MVIKHLKNRQKPLEYTVILVFWGVSSSSKNHQKTSKTVRVYSFSPFLRGYQKPSKIVKNTEYTGILVFWGVGGGRWDKGGSNNQSCVMWEGECVNIHSKKMTTPPQITKIPRDLGCREWAWENGKCRPWYTGHWKMTSRIQPSKNGCYNFRTFKKNNQTVISPKIIKNLCSGWLP